MVRISNWILSAITMLTILFSFAGIGFSLWLDIKSDSECQRVIRMPLLVVSAAVIVVSMAGLVGSCCRATVLLWLYLIVLFLIILGLIAFTVFAIVVTNKGVGGEISGKGVGGVRLGDYSEWLQRYVVNDENWGKIKSCLVDVKMCQRIEGGKGEEAYRKELLPLASGCCTPPNYCGFEFHNATYWTVPSKGPTASQPDCKAWSNIPTQLCFDCELCKTAVLQRIKKEWKMLAFFNVCVLVLVIFIYSVGCCALRNNRSGYGKFKSYG